MRSQAPPTAVPEVQVPVGSAALAGNLAVPARARGLVIFAHGSGSSRHSPRNVYVARQLEAAGVATLLMDLLTRAEEAVDERTREHRFDIPLLADRLVEVARWTASKPVLAPLPIGYFGASTGAGAALLAAAMPGARIDAIVSRGGRPDLAGADALSRVSCPTLLVVGGDDFDVIELNRRAYASLRCVKDLAIVPGASHLFVEPGALEAAARLARDWFTRHLAAADHAARSAGEPNAVP